MRRALVPASFVIALALPSLANASEFQQDCEKLNSAEADELAARAHLTLKSAPAATVDLVRITLRCDQQLAWLEWRTTSRVEVVAIDRQDGLVEDTLAAIEGTLTSGLEQQRKPDGTQFPPEDGSPAGWRPSPKSWHESLGGLGGGVGLALTAERWADTWGAGPQLDIAVTLTGPFTLVAAEGWRIAMTRAARNESRARQLSIGAGVGWGAPYVPGHRFGVVALAGSNWLYDDNNLKQALSASLGGRVATSSGPVSLWLGLDLTGRSQTLRLGEGDQSRYRLPALGFAATLGGFWQAHAIE